MTSLELATEIYNDLGQPIDIGTGYIQAWVESNIGTLNNYAQTCFIYFTGLSGFAQYTGVSGFTADTLSGQTGLPFPGQSFYSGVYDSGTSGYVLSGFASGTILSVVNADLYLYTDPSGNITSGSGITGVSGYNLSGIVGVPSGFVPTLSGIEKDMYKLIFFQRYYNRAATANLGAASYDGVLEIQEFDSRIRRTSKNDIAKTYRDLANSAQQQLEWLLYYYRQGKSPPRGVFGDDVFQALSGPDYMYNNGISPQFGWRMPNNEGF